MPAGMNLVPAGISPAGNLVTAFHEDIIRVQAREIGGKIGGI
jgi:hypothetical protein